MKRKFHEGEAQPIVKTSISLPEVLMRFAQERCNRDGFATISAYLTHLMRLDREREEAKARRYPPHAEQFTRVEEAARSVERQEGLKEILSSAAKPAAATAGISGRPGSPPPDDSAAAPAPVPAPPSNPPAASGRSAPKKARTSSSRKPT